MKPGYQIVFSALLLLLSFTSYAQMEKADKYYDEYKYQQAIALYKPLADSGNIRAVRKIADCYRRINEYEQAEKYYAITVADKNAIPSAFLYYGQSLMNNEKYDEAKIWLKKYISLKEDQDNTLAKTLLLSCEKAKEKPAAERKVKTGTIKWLNSEASDFSAVPFENGILFTSTRNQNNSATSGPEFQKIYFAKLSNDTAVYIEAVKGVVNTKNYNSGPACVNATQDILYFTKNNFQYGDAITNKKGDVTLKIFSAKKEKDSWKDIHELELNDVEYSCAFPAINPDGNILYFTSDRAGGVGGKDIYYSTFSNGKWSKPKNCGKNINTSGDERYPFVHTDGSLYFSSTGWQGYGGMDIYKCTPNKLGEFGKAEKIGKPFNSAADDFGFYLDGNYSKGYFSSNRSGGAGSDDIYWFEYETIPLELTVLCEGKKEDNIQLTIEKNKQKESDILVPSTSVVELNSNADYLLTISKDGYTSQQITVKTSAAKKPIVRTINLSALKSEN